ncbi:MAG: leucine-rich repeat domain-containing protein [Halioglobus sp.]
MAKHHHFTGFRRWSALAIAIVLGGCQGVDVVFNETVFYTSTDLFTDYKIPDSGLSGCVERAILEQRMTAPEQLRRLHCIEAGVTSLEGLDQFPKLERLDLTGNYDLPCNEASRLTTVTTLILPEQCQ